jgi:hypothetical protein
MPHDVPLPYLARAENHRNFALSKGKKPSKEEMSAQHNPATNKLMYNNLKIKERKEL